MVSEIEDEYPSVKDVPDIFPAVKAEIIDCSTYAVVCRLKSSPLYTITSDGGSFNHPNYPGVLITIPKNAVPPKGKFNLQVKVKGWPLNVLFSFSLLDKVTVCGAEVRKIIQ